jgi:hypothetical protein
MIIDGVVVTNGVPSIIFGCRLEEENYIFIEDLRSAVMLFDGECIPR